MDTVCNSNTSDSDQSRTQSVEAPGAPDPAACLWCEKPLPEGRWKCCCAKCGHAASNSRRNVREGRPPRKKPSASPAQKAWADKAEPPSRFVPAVDKQYIRPDGATVTIYRPLPSLQEQMAGDSNGRPYSRRAR